MCRVRRGCAVGVGGRACDGELGAHLEVGHHLCRLLVRVGRLLVSDDGQCVLVQPRVHRRRHRRHVRRSEVRVSRRVAAAALRHRGRNPGTESGTRGGTVARNFCCVFDTTLDRRCESSFFPGLLTSASCGTASSRPPNECTKFSGISRGQDGHQPKCTACSIDAPTPMGHWRNRLRPASHCVRDQLRP